MPERWQQELGKLKTLEPSAGLWDRVLRGPRREPLRAHRAWPVIAPIAAAIAVAAVVVGVFGLVRAFGPAGRRPASVVGYRPGRFVDPVFGWTIRVPAGLRARHFQVPCIHSPVAGVRVTSFAPDLRAASTGIPPMGWLRSFPADGVAVQISYGCSLPFPAPLRDSAFPLSRSSFHRTRPYVGGTEPHPWYCGCYGDGISFAATVWIGPRASRAEQQAAWAVVRSLRFPALREGTIYPALGARRIYEDTYYVLGPASRYPVGSVTTVLASSLPGSRAIAAHVPGGFFLIHAPRTFYVIHRQFQEPTKPYIKCTLAFDARAFQFYCPGTDLRWSRVGQPIGARARPGQDLHLPLAPATVAQDGHVLFSPFWGDVLGVVLKGSPWG
jgi:hypothetical protein